MKYFRLATILLLATTLAVQLFLISIYDVAGNEFMGDDDHSVLESMFLPYIFINLGLLILFLFRSKADLGKPSGEVRGVARKTESC